MSSAGRNSQPPIANRQWPRVRLGEVCFQDRRLVEPGTTAAKELRYIGLENVESNTGRILPANVSGEESPGQSTTFAFDKRHVLYGKLRPYLNKVALPDFEGRCTTELVPLLPSDKITREFLAMILRRPETVAAAMREKTGSRMPRADLGQLFCLEVPFPPLPEQRRIAARLKEQLAAVEQARAQAQAQLDEAEMLPAAFLRDVFSKPIWQGVKVVRLGQLLSLRKDVVHPHDHPKGPAIFVGLEHIESGTGKRLGSVPVRMEALTGRKPRFQKGDIVYGYLRPYLNKLWVAEFEGLCSVDQYAFAVERTLADVEFVAAFMRSPAFLRRAPISTTPGQLPRIRTDEVASVPIELPSLKVQRETADQLQQLLGDADSLRTALTAQLAALDALPNALLREAFGGAD